MLVKVVFKTGGFLSVPTRHKSCGLPKGFRDRIRRDEFWRIFAPKVSKLFRTLERGECRTKIIVEGGWLDSVPKFYIKLPSFHPEQFDDTWVKILHLLLETLEEIEKRGSK